MCIASGPPGGEIDQNALTNPVTQSKGEVVRASADAAALAALCAQADLTATNTLQEYRYASSGNLAIPRSPDHQINLLDHQITKST